MSDRPHETDAGRIDEDGKILTAITRGGTVSVTPRKTERESEALNPKADSEPFPAKVLLRND